MGFKPGHKKAGGRKAGVPNKPKQSLLEKCEAFGLDPFEGLLELAMDPDKSFRMSALKEICQYVYPKKKAIEVNGNVNLDLAKKAEEYEALPVEEQITLMEAEIKRLRGET